MEALRVEAWFSTFGHSYKQLTKTQNGFAKEIAPTFVSLRVSLDVECAFHAT